ncbi:MAG: hypothetical protein H6822_15775 [Planctomycetaceae bacterium]|nr:hypothetical protein [Planctomycetales bacterium]MCB9923639.1 hypothetical protein [Planctomycetaceae bacterium]
MKNLLWLCLLTVLSPGTLSAQEAGLPAPQPRDDFFLPERSAQTDFANNYERYETPQQLVHRNAALKGAQRRERMATNARFGYSPSRPPASTVPAMGSPAGPPTGYGFYSPYPGFLFPRPYSRF